MIKVLAISFKVTSPMPKLWKSYTNVLLKLFDLFPSVWELLFINRIAASAGVRKGMGS